jgi:hypothetical protein
MVENIDNIPGIVFLHKVKKWFITFLLIFVVFNIIAFSVPITTKSYGKPYAKAKAYLTSAATVNVLYIFPLSKVFGYRSFITLPFYGIRDYLYNKGISLFPKDEGEREIWWFTVRYAEYETLIHPMVQSFVGANSPYRNKGAMLLAWQDELTAHLEPFATLKIKDTEMRKYRFNMFINYALSAMTNRGFVVRHYIFKRDGYLDYYQNEEEFKKMEMPLIYYQKLKKYAEKNERDGLDYLKYETKNAYIEDVLQFKTTRELIDFLLVTKKFRCDHPYVKINGESFSRLYDLAKTSTYHYRRLHDLRILGFTYGGPRYTLYKCENNPEFIKYREYIEKTFFYRESDKEELIELKKRIKNGIFKGY